MRRTGAAAAAPCFFGIPILRGLRRLAPAVAVVAGFAVAPLLAVAQGTDPVETTRRIAATGATALALARVDELQPKDPRAARWAQWEALRVGLLVDLGRDADALERATAEVERDLPNAAARDLWRDVARASVRLKRGEQARRYYARLLWSGNPEPAEQRRWRLGVIESYLAEGGIDDAYRSMLRFQQDFQPLERAEAVRFAGALLDANRPLDAATWLGQLEQGSALAASLRLRAGLIQPDEAIAQGRALAAKGQDPASAWRLVQEGAASRRNAALEIEALEQQLALLEPRASAAIAARASTLWERYTQTAQQAANQAHLISGDDAAWADRASRLLASEPQLARALFAHLAGAARTPAARGNAQLQLVTSLVEGKLATAALRLFADVQRHPVASLDAHARYVLGTIAADARQPELAVRLWSGLPTPAALSQEEWRARTAAEMVRAGMTEPAIAAVRALTESGRPLPAAVFARLMQAGRDALGAYQARPAEALHGLLLPVAPEAERGALLAGLARARELLGDHRGAADALLQAALLVPENDPVAVRARETAAGHLLRAGLKDDARALYRWVARNARDPAVREHAAREAARL